MSGKDCLQKPVVSVIIPVYKVEEHLSRCVESVRSQTLKEIEIILVDDGSPDRCPQMCEELAKEDERIRVIHQENQGLSAARNTGIRAARGEWIMFVDSDDAVLPGFCEKPWKAAVESGADIVAFDYRRYELDGTVRDLYTPYYTQGLYSRKDIMNALASECVKDYAWNKIYRKELFAAIRYPAGEYWEDMATAYLLIDSAGSVYILREILYEYYIRKNSISLERLFRTVTGEILAQREKEYAFFEERYPQAAEKMEWAITCCELDYCMYRCMDPADEKYREVRARVLKRKSSRKALGTRIWLKTRSLRFPLLFCILTTDRRRRMNRNA